MWVHSQTAGLDNGLAGADQRAHDVTASHGQCRDKLQEAAQFPSKTPEGRSSYSRAAYIRRSVLLLYLGVRLGHLLVQALVAVDGELQLLHLRR